MSRVILSVGVTKSNIVHSTNSGFVSMKRMLKHPGSNILMMPIIFPKGKNLETQRKEAHRLIDECIDVFKKECMKG
jgi:hypothetical protein